MATANFVIYNGTPPYTISVKKEGEEYERFRGYADNVLTFEPATDGVQATYVIRTTDANGCSPLVSPFYLACGTQNCNMTLFLIPPTCNGGNSASLPMQVNNGVGPFTISIKKQGEGYERFRNYDGTIVYFEPATDGVAATYALSVKDSRNCVQETYIYLTCSN